MGVLDAARGERPGKPKPRSTAVVHRRLGVPGAWRIGTGTASERAHWLPMLGVAPAAAFWVAAAGDCGFALSQWRLAQGVGFLRRMSASITLAPAAPVR